MRLCQWGYEAGLLPENKYRAFAAKKQAVEQLLEFCSSRRHQGKTLLSWLNECTPDDITDNFTLPFPAGLLPEFAAASKVVQAEVLTMAHYDGYLQRETRMIERMNDLENEIIPPDFDYEPLSGFSNESKQKLIKHHPQTLAQAGRIDGVTPSDISLLQILIKKHNGRQA